MLKAINLSFKFILELYLSFALGYVGFHLVQGGPVKWLFAIDLPAGVALIWDMLIALSQTRPCLCNIAAISKVRAYV